MKRKDIRVRDPYILLYESVYYMYATTGEKTLSCYTSADLENWSEGRVVFEISEGSWAYKDVWAAEVHRYKGRFYLFVSLLGKPELYPDGSDAMYPENCPPRLKERLMRGTQIAVSDTPTGPFVPLVNRPVTPLEQSCIDGTLFVKDGVPYIFYSHDWPDNYCEREKAYVGQICAARLKDDLTEIVGEPWVVFDSNEVPLSAKTPHHVVEADGSFTRYGSDAPFVQTLSDGRLFLTWSPYLQDTYVVLGAVSESGDIHGPWRHLDEPIFEDNGGHAMFFRNKANELCMVLHAPESQQKERAHLFVMREKDGALHIDRELEPEK